MKTINLVTRIKSSTTNTNPARTKTNHGELRPIATETKLLERLQELPFDAFTQLIAMLLEKLGYQDIQPAGRTDWKGRNREGGVDLTATYSSATGKRSVAFQLKQFHPSLRIFQRTVDELRGVCLRQGVAEGMLITTSSFSTTITGTHSPIAPLYLMGGEELALLLRQYHIGTTRGGKLDEALFKRLERESQGNSPSNKKLQRSRKKAGGDLVVNGDLVVTLSLQQEPWEKPF